MPGSRVSSKRRAAQTATTYSGINAIFWPKPPQTSGVTTRSSDSDG